MIRRPPSSTLFPYPPLFRSRQVIEARVRRIDRRRPVRRCIDDLEQLLQLIGRQVVQAGGGRLAARRGERLRAPQRAARDRKSTRLNSSHGYISYAVFCLKKK